MRVSYNEFHVSRAVRDKCQFDEQLFSSSGNVIIVNMSAIQKFAQKLNALFDANGESQKRISAGSLNAMGLIDEIFHYICMVYRRDKCADSFKRVLADLDAKFTPAVVDKLLLDFMAQFPPVEVYQGKCSAQDYLKRNCIDAGTKAERSNREQTLEELILLRIANEDPAFRPFNIMFNDVELQKNPTYDSAWAAIQKTFTDLPKFGPFNHDLINMLREPIVYSPMSLKKQLDYIRQYWADLIGDLLRRLLEGMDTLSEEEKMAWGPSNGGDVNMDPYDYSGLMKEYERFSPDRDWMPRVILMAKTVLVWLSQLTKKFGRPITRLDEIPDSELDTLAAEGFTGLWLIGLWERSAASRRIKQICGNPEAAASAYSLYNYNIAGNIGGWDALSNLRARLWQRGIRLASDMVPNHTGMDSEWVINRPDLFMQRRDPPSPSYDYNSENLSQDGRVGVYLESHYYNRTDCAVVFKRVDNQTGDTRYIYHGNDGTGMPWCDTAQIDFLNPEAREAVMQDILHVARNFPIIRFDAAMVLAKKSIRRLWYPRPGSGGDIYSRAQSSLSDKEFEERIPNEFWREVVDRVAKEVPDTLLLAEAFWMMEGYFVRTLGMHRVYNSAFMNMLKKEENQKYRDTVKNTIKFDREILKRYVNFMNNPDEDTAVAQFGSGDKYFGVCTLMVTMPGLPMFGHGQIEGFTEKYGMEFTKAYRDERPDEGLVARHWRDIFPLMHKRYIFSGVEDFLFYDVWDPAGWVNENIFAYSNKWGDEKSVVFYNNKYDRAQGWIKQSCEYAVKTGSGDQQQVHMETKSIGEALGLSYSEDKFCIFREHRTGGWFIRRSREVCDRGLFTMLNGFEYQVYMDIREVSDTADHKYSILCDLLNGAPCADLEVAWEEHCYKGLYEVFLPFIEAVIKSLFVDDKSSDLKADETAESIETLALKFYEKADEFCSHDKRIDTAQKEYEKFSRAFEAITTCAKKATGKPATDLAASLKGITDAKKWSETLFVTCENLPGLLIVYAAVADFSKAGWAAKWGLARKVEECYKKLGVLKSDVRGDLERLWTLSPVCDAKAVVKDAKKANYAIARVCAEEPTAPSLFGGNIYNGVAWFKKELSDYTLTNIGALLLIDCGEGDLDAMVRDYHTLAEAKEKAEYKCEEFVKAFAPEKPKSTTPKEKSK